MSIVEQAAELARYAHAGQQRKWSQGVPYIVHPERVAAKVASLKGVNEEDVAAAWLHDVIEDCSPEYAADIQRNFSPAVYELVKELTFETEGAEWAGKPRAEKNKVRFAHMRRMSDRAKRIKMVDRWDNLNDMENAPHKLVRKTCDESWELLDICKEADPAMASELKDAILRRQKGR
jgi:(p)ppGpp synthase/HD superfamily hydrolase